MSKFNIAIQNIIPYLIFLLIILNSLSLFYYGTNLSKYGKITIELTIFISIVVLLYYSIDIYLKRRELHNILKPVYISIVILMTSYLITHLANKNFNFDKTLVHLYISFAYLIAIALVRWTKNHLYVMSFISNLIIIFILIFWGYQGYSLNRFGYSYLNTNLASVFALCLIFFQSLLLTSKNKFIKAAQFILILGTLIIIYITSSRATLIVTLVVFIAWILMKYAPHIFSKVFHAVLLINILFIVIYTKMTESSILNYINNFSQMIFNKELFSGRESIWNEAVDFGLKSPLIGFRIDIQPEDYIPNTPYAHVHNYYIQVFLESGLLGLISFILVIYVIWRMYMKNLDSKIVQICSCFFIGILVYWNLDLSSFFVNKAIGLMFWFIIGLGISASIYNQSKRET